MSREPIQAPEPARQLQIKNANRDDPDPSPVRVQLPTGDQRNKFDPVDTNPLGHGCCGWLILILYGLFYIITWPVLIWFSFTTIQSYERGIQLRLGRLQRRRGVPILSSGIHCLLPCIDRIFKVDMRTSSMNIPPQEVLTMDSVTVTVDAVVFMRVIDPASAVLRVDNRKKAAQLLAVSLLRTAIGEHSLAELLSNREQIDEKLLQELDGATDAWGIMIERVEIKDVSLPQDIQRAMAAEAQASRAARAKVIAAEGELNAAKTLQEAAAEMSRSPAALQLRYMQTLTTIATEQNSTIIFPLPMELLNGFQMRANPQN